MTAPLLDAAVSVSRAGGWPTTCPPADTPQAQRVLETMTPAAVREEVRKASLRGRGGAGFPAGVKWGFVPQEGEGPRYLCVNADEGEPGTFKDRPIMTRAPHLLLEGIIIASYAVGARTAFIYIRGEYEMIARRLEAAVAESRRPPACSRADRRRSWSIAAPAPMSAARRRLCSSRSKASEAGRA